jgi:uncharacterized protein YceK
MKRIVLVVLAVLLLGGCGAMMKGSDFYMGYLKKAPDGFIYEKQTRWGDYRQCLDQAKKKTGHLSNWKISEMCSQNEDCRQIYDQCLRDRGYERFTPWPK